MKKRYVLILILILTIGFASINTVLDLKGNVSIGFKEDDFNVIISKVIMDEVDVSNNISEDKQSFTFTGTGSNKIEYTITNKSYQYDANVNLVCEPNNDLLINQVGEVVAQSRKSATIEVNSTGVITCRMDIDKISKTEIAEDMCEYDVGQTWEFNYTGSEQEFVVPCDGDYKIELWGAQGGTPNVSYPGGKGAYVSGNINLNENIKLYLYVGSAGQTKIAGYNGGGTGGDFANRGSGSGGGGATDIRLIKTSPNDFEGLKSRIIVAAGGGGGSYYGDSTGSWGHVAGINGDGGTLSGIKGYYKFVVYDSRWGSNNLENIGGKGGTQTAGGSAGSGYIGTGKSGTFGTGATYNSEGAAAGGGGYYGGGSSARNGFSGGGGSSFISGHNGCNAISESSTSSKIIHTGQPNHYSGYVFTNTQMIAGNEVMLSHDGLSTMTGNTGHGYAKITYLG